MGECKIGFPIPTSVLAESYWTCSGTTTDQLTERLNVTAVSDDQLERATCDSRSQGAEALAAARARARAGGQPREALRFDRRRRRRHRRRDGPLQRFLSRQTTEVGMN